MTKIEELTRAVATARTNAAQLNAAAREAGERSNRAFVEARDAEKALTEAVEAMIACPKPTSAVDEHIIRARPDPHPPLG